METSVRRSNKLFTVRNMMKISMLAVLSFVVMVLNFPVIPQFDFLKLDFAEVFALLGGFAMGPVAGVIIVVLKNALHLLRTQTIGIGELSNIIVGCSLVFPAALIYSRKKNLKHALIGSVVGVLCMTTVGFFSNYFLILPMYIKAFGYPETLFWRTLVAGIIPFNLIKGSLVSLATFLLYKRVSPILHK